jgi:hypothetical protein
MKTRDGSHIVSTNSQSKIEPCTRWEELRETIAFMAQLSEALRVPSEFRLLNGSEPIICGLGDDDGESYDFLR